jgi:hypothetical protein
LPLDVKIRNPQAPLGLAGEGHGGLQCRNDVPSEGGIVHAQREDIHQARAAEKSSNEATCTPNHDRQQFCSGWPSDMETSPRGKSSYTKGGECSATQCLLFGERARRESKHHRQKRGEDERVAVKRTRKISQTG